MKNNNSQQKKSNKHSKDFSQDVFSNGFEGLIFIIYALLVPYVLGMLFYLVYIGDGIFNIFSSIPIYMTWIVGYEVLSVFVLLYLVLKLFSSISRR